MTDQIKVLIIGTDGVARKHWVDHNAQFYANKYKIDQDAIYHSQEGFIVKKEVPTIMFRENNVIAISFKTKPSIPDPDEMGSSISRAAWAIAELMRKKDNTLQMVLLLVMIAACILAGAAAYMSYNNGTKITTILEKLNQTYTPPSSTNYPSYSVPSTGSPTLMPTITPTQNIEPTPTPLPQISIA